MPKVDPYDYFPFRVDIFLADLAVQQMNTQAIGAYLLLLLAAWKQKPAGTIPDDDTFMREHARMQFDDPTTGEEDDEAARKIAQRRKKSDDEWRACKKQVLKAFKFDEKKSIWKQTRMMLEHKKIRDSLKAKSEGGKKGAKSRWDTHESPIADPQHINLNLNLNSNLNPPAAQGAGAVNGNGEAGKELRGTLELFGVSGKALDRCCKVPGVTPIGVYLLAKELNEQKRLGKINAVAGVLVARLTNGYTPPATIPVEEVCRLGNEGLIGSICGRDVTDARLRYSNGALVLPDDSRIPAADLKPENIQLRKA